MPIWYAFVYLNILKIHRSVKFKYSIPLIEFLLLLYFNK